MGDENKTPEQLAEERRRDVMAYAYRETDGKLYSIDKNGDLVEIPAADKADKADKKVLELSPEYHKIANQTAAIAVLYPRIIALNADDQGLLGDFLSGKKEFAAGMNKELGDVWEELKKKTGFDPSLPGSDIFAAAGSVADGIKAPFVLMADALKSGKAIWDQLSITELSRNEALAIGVARASAAQVAAESHKGFEFSSLSSWSAHIMAGIKFVTTWLCDKFDIDKEHSWGWHKKDADFSKLLENEYRAGDNERVEKEMKKLAKIGGVDSEKLAVFVRGGLVAGLNGEEEYVGAADSDHSGPKVDGADTDLDTALKNRDNAPKPGLMDRLKQAKVDFSESSATAKSAGVSGLAGGAAGVYQGGRGFAEGLKRNGVTRVVTQAEEAEAAVQELDKAIKTAKDAGKDHLPRSAKFWKKPETVAAAEERLAALKDDAVDLGKKAAHKVDNASAFTRAAQGELKGANLIEKTWNVPRHIGRWFGDVTEAGLNMCKNAAVGSYSKAKALALGILPTAAEATNGVVEGTNGVVTGAQVVSSNPSTARAVARTLGKWGAHGLKIFEPAVAFGKAVFAFGDNDGVGEATYSVTTGAMVGTIAKIGARRAIPLLAPIMSGGELANAAIKGDGRGVRQYGVELATIGGFAATGAALGLCGGPFAPITCTAGAIGGTVVGGIVSIFTGWKAASNYDETHPKGEASQPAAPSTKPDAGLATAVIDSAAKTKAAQDSVKREGLVFTGTVLNQVGAVGDGMTPLLTNGIVKPRDYNLVS